MTNLEIVKKKLYDTKASLVVLYANGVCKEYYQNRIYDIKEILRQDRLALQGATIADKVIGKVAGSILTLAGVKEIYADVMSKYAVLILEEYQIPYQYEKLVDYIENNAKDGMCPMENKYKEEQDLHKIYQEMIENNN